MNNKYVALVVVALVIVGGGSFYGGMQYDKSVTAQARASARSQFGGGGGNGQGGQGGQQRSGMMGGKGQGGGFVIGEVLSKDDKSITVKTPDGGSTIVYFSSTLNVRKADTASLSDVTVGEQVTINGKGSSDGSISADTISITPAGVK